VLNKKVHVLVFYTLLLYCLFLLQLQKLFVKRVSIFFNVIHNVYVPTINISSNICIYTIYDICQLLPVSTPRCHPHGVTITNVPSQRASLALLLLKE